MAETTDTVFPRLLDQPILDVLSDRLHLSRREGQIVSRILSACKEPDIARELGISPHTLRTHVERLYRKLHVVSRMELAVRLYESYLSLTCERGSPFPPLCAHRTANGCPFRH
jgi:DNA-binding CsgD family transcriptional regulator